MNKLMKLKCIMIVITYPHVKLCGGYSSSLIDFRIHCYQMLSFHLHDEQTILYTDNDDLGAISILERPNIESTKSLGVDTR